MNEKPTTLNPGIRKTVEFLQDCGFNTCDSGDGATHDFACDLPFPYVHIQVDSERLVSETNRLVDLLANAGVVIEPAHPESPNAPTIEACYLPAQEAAFIHLYNIILP